MAKPDDPSRAVDLASRVAEFVAAADSAPDSASGSGAFDRLADRIVRLQLDAYPSLRRLATARGLDPAAPVAWRQLPPVPVRAFRTTAFHLAPPREVFRSSGTTGGEAARSVHHHPFPDLYRQVIDATFARACFPRKTVGRRPMLSLIDTRAQRPDSSLAFLADHVLERHGAPDSVTAFGARGVDIDAANAFCAARERDGRPATVLATAFALADWLDALAATGRRIRLPAGSTVFETGGYKGRRRTLEPEEVVARVADRLGIEPTALVREYGMTELTSHAYTDVLAGGDRRLFVPPPFLAVRVLDPATLVDLPIGAEGLVGFFDLANVGSVASIVSQDLGRLEPLRGATSAAGRSSVGLRLLGRAEGAALRGCSLAVEELG